MIFIDTNVFLRALVDKSDEASKPLRIQAMNLFRSIRDGELEATTSEVVLHELCFIATAKTHYSMEVLDVIGFVRAFLSLEGFRFPPGERVSTRAPSTSLKPIPNWSSQIRWWQRALSDSTFPWRHSIDD